MGRNKKTEFVSDNGILEEKEVKKTYSYTTSRAFTLVTYIALAEILTFLKMSTWVHHWALCVHDMDLNTDGTPKTEHIHIVLYTFSHKTSSAVQKNFDRYSNEIYRYCEQDPQNTRCEICYDMLTQYRYLIHKDDPDKYQYSPCRRITDNDIYWNELEYSSGQTDAVKNKALAIIEDMRAGMKEIDLVKRYGTDYVYHRPQYLVTLHSILCEEHKPNTDIMEIVQICLSSPSVFSQDQINTFYNVLTHLKAECLREFKKPIDFYLIEGEKKEK